MQYQIRDMRKQYRNDGNYFDFPGFGILINSYCIFLKSRESDCAGCVSIDFLIKGNIYYWPEIEKLRMLISFFRVNNWI